MVKFGSSPNTVFTVAAQIGHIKTVESFTVALEQLCDLYERCSRQKIWITTKHTSDLFFRSDGFTAIVPNLETLKPLEIQNL
jgi:hypothetical protein